VDAREAIRRNNFEKPKKKNWKAPPTDQDRKIAYSYSAYGATQEDIATALGMDFKTLTKYFKEELEAGRATAKNTIAQKIYQVAVGRDAITDPETGQELAPAVKPNLSALIFLAKTRLGWKETQVVEQSVEMKSGGVQIYLPDNGMRCSEDINGR
jgi:transcriptional regulator with XRE-family HTH domain